MQLKSIRRATIILFGAGLLGALVLSEARSDGDAKQKKESAKQKDAKGKFAQFLKGSDAAKKSVAPPAPRSALLTVEAWQKASISPLRPGEIDELVAKEQQENKVAPAPLTTDEQFIRRATLDLTGVLPLPADVKEFVADKDSRKRAKLIDRLLDSDDYARHWAHYWRDVFIAHLTDRRAFVLVRSFEDWLRQELKKNTSWGEIAKAMIAAEGACRIDENTPNGAAFFLASHNGADAANERASETSRIFLGIQLQCAQCHDHPSDQWRRVQFHEMAGYYARLRERPIREDKRIVGVQLFGAASGEHEMPSKEDPKQGLVTPPRFLNGKSPGNNLSDTERRQALAREIVNKDNYWFAGAYVNRVWGTLMGQSFYEPVDDMGPQKNVVFPTVLTRLTGSFRSSNYDIKGLFRDVMNSQTYQRQIRLSDPPDAHLHFAAAYPTRLSAEALWQSLTGALGSMGGPRDGARAMMTPQGFRAGLEGTFKQEFGFDPSLKPDEIEGSIPQALLLMNNPVINQRIQAKDNNLLARILSAYPDDDEALRTLYLRTLARKPTDKEMEACKKLIQKVGQRAEAFEDILWALINSTEFQTKR